MRPLPDDDPLATLSERVRAAQAAAERLADEAQARGDVPHASQDATAEIQALVGLVQAARGLVPEELWAQLTQLVRQLLLLVRAIVEWWLERVDGSLRGPAPAEPPRVEDIPLD
jgi:hypothetical protein